MAKKELEVMLCPVCLESQPNERYHYARVSDGKRTAVFKFGRHIKLHYVKQQVPVVWDRYTKGGGKRDR
ncbi:MULTISPECIES: hypothetical protein [Bacillus]|uniref:hypothetical protein n=1 Tax=Bacillus TaxID=1386 RepID=UPI00031CA4E8|nr:MULTISPECIES: hypothetical protein [Bacillus]